MSGRNRGYLNSSPYFCKVEIEDICIAVLVLGRVGNKGYSNSSPNLCQVQIEDILIAILIFDNYK